MKTRSLVVGYFPAIFLAKSDAPHSTEVEVYGPVHEEAQRLFEAKLAQQRDFAEREQAVLSSLSGKPKD